MTAVHFPLMLIHRIEMMLDGHEGHKILKVNCSYMLESASN